jgi:hypothetical protein
VRVHIETKLVRSATDREAPLRFSAAANVMTALSAVTADAPDGTVMLHAAATVHAENRAWLVQLLSIASLLQHLKAEQASADFAKAVQGEPDQSEMPGAGPRHEPGDLLNSAAMFQQAGARDPVAADDFVGVQKMLRGMTVGRVGASDDGLTIELDAPAEHPAKLITVRNQHPDLGHGVLQLLQLHGWRTRPALPNSRRSSI